MKRIQLPSVDELKKAKCPAAIGLMMYQMYALIPDVPVAATEGDKEKVEKRRKHMDDVVSRLVKARSIEGFIDVGRFMLKGTGLFDKKKRDEELFDYEELRRPEGMDKYRDLVDWFGLELCSWASADFLKAKHREARAKTGESMEKLTWEFVKEDEEKAKKEGKARTLTDEEKKKEEEVAKKMEMYLHDRPEAWHPLKRISRKLDIRKANDAKDTDEDWAKFAEEQQKFVARFGLKYIRFPYVMGLEDRKKGLIDMEDNLQKIAIALEMPEHYIGFRGRMPVYYGGAVSGSLGTYTHLTHTLYVLKDMGDRATAHEWFHALDFDLAFQTGTAAMNSGNAPSFSEPHLLAAYDKMKPVQQAMIAFLDGVQGGFNGGEPVNAKDFVADDGIFWTVLSDVYATELFRWVPVENKDRAVQRFNYACKQLQEGVFKPERFTEYVSSEYSNGLSLTEPEMKDMMLTSFKDEIRILSGLYQELKEDPEYFKGERSSFTKWFAEQLDNRSGRPYYTIPTEIVARMGEQYVFDKIGAPLKEHKTPQYAMDFERAKIQERFAAWLNEAKVFLAHEPNREKKKEQAPNAKI